MKKSSSVVFLLLLIIAYACAPQSIAQVIVNDIYYEINNETHTASVTCVDDNNYSGTLDIPSQITYFGTSYVVNSINAIKDCPRLTTINFPHSLTTIEPNAIVNCDRLSSIIIPDSVTSIGNGNFRNCKRLSSIIVSEGNPVFDSREDCNAIIDTNNTLIAGCRSTIIPNGVERIAHQAFEDCTELTSITLPVTVKQIGKKALAGCSSLTSITIPHSVTLIEDSAFYNCSTITSINIPPSVTVYNNGIFANCSGLISVTIPKTVGYIDDKAFAGCYSLISIIVERGNSVYDSRNNCNAVIESATNTLIVACSKSEIPNSITAIGSKAYANCQDISSFEVPRWISEINEQPFIYAGQLTSISVDKDNKSYDSREDCNAIIHTATNTLTVGCNTSVIPSSVTAIGNRAFSHCNGIKHISLPANIQEIAREAFFCCDSLQYIYCHATTPPHIDGELSLSQPPLIVIVPPEALLDYKKNYAWSKLNIEVECIEGVCYNITSTTTVEVIYRDEKLNNYVDSIIIPDVVKIGNREYSVTSISDRAFYNYNGLKSIKIGNNVTQIGDEAFAGCNSLKQVYMGRNIAAIGNNAFAQCPTLKHIEIQALTPPSITSNTFSDTRTTVVVSPLSYNNYTHELSLWRTLAIEPHIVDGFYLHKVTENALEITHRNDQYNSYNGDIVIPHNITIDNTTYPIISIGANAFKDCADLNSITLHQDLHTIGDKAFENCSSLTAVHIPNIHYWCNVTFADSTANPLFYAHQLFVDNTAINKLVLPDSITSINDYAFAGFSQLEEIKFNDIITNIGNYAFLGCSGLPEIEIPETVTNLGIYVFKDCTELKNVSMRKNITVISEGLFENCSGLSKIKLQKTVVLIGANAFAHCHSLVSLAIPNNVATIGNRAFYNCTSLKSLIIPKSVTEIGNDAFKGCVEMKSIKIPDHISDDILERTSIEPQVKIKR